LSKPELEKIIRENENQWKKAAKDLDFMQAAKYVTILKITGTIP
jgi:excinuclease ABC subunit B